MNKHMALYKKTLILVLMAVLLAGCNMFVNNQPTEGAKATGLSLTAPGRDLKVGEEAALLWSFTPEGSAMEELLFISSDERVATVDENGVVSARSEGECTITGTADSGLSASAEIRVKGWIRTKLELDAEKDILVVGETLQLEYLWEPASAAKPNVVWDTSDKSVARVNKNGLVTAVGEGVVIIKIMAAGTIAEYPISVVTPAPNKEWGALDGFANKTVAVGTSLVYTQPDNLSFTCTTVMGMGEVSIQSDFVDGVKRNIVTFIESGLYAIDVGEARKDGSFAALTVRVLATDATLPQAIELEAGQTTTLIPAEELTLGEYFSLELRTSDPSVVVIPSKGSLAQVSDFTVRGAGPGVAEVYLYAVVSETETLLSTCMVTVTGKEQPPSVSIKTYPENDSVRVEVWSDIGCTLRAELYAGTLTAQPVGVVPLQQKELQGKHTGGIFTFTGLSPQTPYTIFVYGVRPSGVRGAAAWAQFTLNSAPAPAPTPVPAPTPAPVQTPAPTPEPEPEELEILGDSILYTMVGREITTTYRVTGGATGVEATMEFERQNTMMEIKNATLTQTGEGIYTLTIPGPTASGLHYIKLKAVKNGETARFHIRVSVSDAMGLTPTTLPEATRNTYYNQTLSISGGEPPYTELEFSSGALPAGMTLGRNSISGTPTGAAGLYKFTLRATDCRGNVMERGYELALYEDITVNGDGAITLQEGYADTQRIYTLAQPFGEAKLALGTPNTARAALAAAGNGSYQLTIPAGLSVGEYSVRLQVEPWGRAKDVSVVVRPRGFVPVTGITGVPEYVLEGQTVTLGGTVLPSDATNKTVTWSIVSGVTYCTLNGNRLTGNTASSQGAHPVVRATIKDGKAEGDYVQEFEIPINAPVTLDKTPGMLPDVIRNGSMYVQEFTAMNGAGGPYTILLKGQLPGWLTFQPTVGGESTAKLTGRLTEASSGTWTFTLVARDKDGNSKEFGYTLTVYEPLGLFPQEGALPQASRYEAYFASVIAAGGSGSPYKIELVEGSLPAGLTMQMTPGDESAHISGTPTDKGTSSFKLQVTDRTGNTKQYSYTLTVGQYHPSVPVTDITGLPTAMIDGQTITLGGTVVPGNASKKQIQWSLADPNDSVYAQLEGNSLTGTGGGKTIELVATIVNGATDGDFVKHFLVRIDYDIEVLPQAGTLQATLGQPYHQVFAAINGAGEPYKFNLLTPNEDILNMGLSFTASSTQITLSGTPTKAGTYEFSVGVTDSSGHYKEFGRYYLTVTGSVLEKNATCATEFPLMDGVFSGTTPVPSAEPTPVPSAEPTPVPSAEPTPVPSAEPTPAPSAEPTPAPSAEPTPAPSAEPTPAPSAEPTPEPSAEPVSAQYAKTEETETSTETAVPEETQEPTQTEAPPQDEPAEIPQPQPESEVGAEPEPLEPLPPEQQNPHPSETAEEEVNEIS